MQDKQKIVQNSVAKLKATLKITSISKVVEAYLVVKKFSVYFATSLVKAWLNTKTETPALDPRRNAGKRDKPLTLGGYWGRRRVMQCAFSLFAQGVNLRLSTAWKWFAYYITHACTAQIF